MADARKNHNAVAEADFVFVDLNFLKVLFATIISVSFVTNENTIIVKKLTFEEALEVFATFDGGVP